MRNKARSRAPIFFVPPRPVVRDGRQGLRSRRAEREGPMETNQRQRAQIARTPTWLEQTQPIAPLGLMGLDPESETRRWAKPWTPKSRRTP